MLLFLLFPYRESRTLTDHIEKIRWRPFIGLLDFVDFISQNALSTLNIFELKFIEFLTSLSSGNLLFSANDLFFKSKSLIATVARTVSAMQRRSSLSLASSIVCVSLSVRGCAVITLFLCRAVPGAIINTVALPEPPSVLSILHLWLEIVWLFLPFACARVLQASVRWRC